MWIATILKGHKEVWTDLIGAAGNWREELMAYFDVTRARMLYTMKDKKKARDFEGFSVL